LDAPSPFVIVECISPPSEYEFLLQGYARNRFCADLFAAGDLKAVCATGMWRGATESALAEMVKALARPTSVGEVFLNSPPSDWPSALFTSDPLLPVWEL
jgi:hypothetical protein